jgi:hypothetical protein
MPGSGLVVRAPGCGWDGCAGVLPTAIVERSGRSAGLVSNCRRHLSERQGRLLPFVAKEKGRGQSCDFALDLGCPELRRPGSASLARCVTCELLAQASVHGEALMAGRWASLVRAASAVATSGEVGADVCRQGPSSPTWISMARCPR